jgi:hypothetical protein
MVAGVVDKVEYRERLAALRVLYNTGKTTFYASQRN